MTINVVERTDDAVKIENALISVSDKRGLESLIPTLIAANPDIRLFFDRGNLSTDPGNSG